MVKVRFGGDINVAALELNTHGDHGDQYRGKDTDESCYLLASEIITIGAPPVTQALTGNGDISHVLDGPGQGKGHANDHSHYTENNRTGSVVGDGVHHGGEGDDMATHDEDGEKNLAQTKQFTTKRTQQDLSGISQVVDVGVSLAKLADSVSGVQRDKTKADDENHGWNQTNCSQSCWQREHTKRHGFGNHDCRIILC